MNFDKDEFDAFMYEVDAVSKQVFRIIIFFSILLFLHKTICFKDFLLCFMCT